MALFLIRADVISLNLVSGDVDIDVDDYQVEATSEDDAVAKLRKRLEYKSETYVRGIHSFEVGEISALQQHEL